VRSPPFRAWFRHRRRRAATHAMGQEPRAARVPDFMRATSRFRTDRSRSRHCHHNRLTFPCSTLLGLV
jgi:hypothetical protein